jgi:octanoyl-[GcvH]:protein N-octanoyltransferase
MMDLTQQAFPELKVAAYEIRDSYCPGTFDLSIDGKKLLALLNDESKMAWQL